jgi:hypothetical protein
MGPSGAIAATVIACAACGFTPASVDTAIDGGGGDGDPEDAAVDAFVLGPWGPPQPVGLAAPEGGDIWVATRTTPTDPWGAPTRVEELADAANETTPRISADGLTLYFSSDRQITINTHDIWMTTRATRNSPWAAPVPVVELDSAEFDSSATATRDGLAIAISSNRNLAASSDIFISTRAATSDAWTTPAAIDAINTAIYEGAPFLSADGLDIYFDTDQGAGDGNDLYQSTRASRSDPFPAAIRIDGLNSPAIDADPWISPDRRHAYWTSNRDGTVRLWHASR